MGCRNYSSDLCFNNNCVGGPPSLGLGADGAVASVCKGSVAPTASQRSQSTGTCPSELKHGTMSWSEQKGGGGAGGTDGMGLWSGTPVRGDAWGLGLLPTRSCLLACLGSCCSQAEREYSKGKYLKAVERIHIYGEKYLFFSNFPFPSPESTYQFSKCCKAHYFPPCHIIHPSIKDGS